MNNIISLYLHSEAPATYLLMLVIFVVSVIGIIKQAFSLNYFFIRTAYKNIKNTTD
jgi:hypothetical protein